MHLFFFPFCKHVSTVIGYSILPLTLAVSTLYVFSPVWYVYVVKVRKEFVNFFRRLNSVS